MDSISLIRTPIEAELRDFKELFDSSLSSSNALLDSVVSHIRQRNGKMMRPILVLLVHVFMVLYVLPLFMQLFHWNSFIQPVWCMTTSWMKVPNAVDNSR